MKIPRMNFVQLLRTVAAVQCLAAPIACCPAATLTDSFSTNVNYLANGVTGTIWDGVYFGAGEFNNSGVGGGGLGATIQCDANITAASKLTLQTTGTAWEGADDDGFFLYRIVKGDFSAIVHVVTPFNNAAYNTAGLQARAFSANGDPSSSGKENYVSWTRFDEFNFPNYLRSEVNGGVTQINPGGYPNGAYWLRMDRNGNVFRFYQRTNSADVWRSVTFPAPVSGTNLTRSDFAGLPLQVGIIHATFNWETKVNYYVTGNADLFASEYAFDSTGFESQELYAKYAMQHLGSSALMGSGNPAAFLQQIQNYSVKQITANVFDRGWLETAYYYYGSDYRGDMGNDYIVTYMSQEGGWGLLDYAYNFATNSADYLRLGYASYLNGWSTMNSGPPPSYGFWYPSAAYDGGCGGGFEPSPYNTTWLGGQPMHRSPWYYSAEQNLGFCGAIRMAATILSDDPIFGRFCYGGTWSQNGTTNQIVPLDGVRKRFHAMLNNGNIHLIVDTDRFATAMSILLQNDLSQVSFQLETANPAAHTAALHVTASTAGTYTFTGVHGVITAVNLVAGQETIVSLPMDAGASPQSFAITR